MVHSLFLAVLEVGDTRLLLLCYIFNAIFSVQPLVIIEAALYGALLSHKS